MSRAGACADRLARPAAWAGPGASTRAMMCEPRQMQPEQQADPTAPGRRRLWTRSAHPHGG
eukprot:1802514-Lingulodinium_polyedra.AAC.1